MTTQHVDHLLDLIASAERLEALPRTGWITSGVQHPESVAAHSYMVTLIALWIADHLDQPVQTEKLLRMALLHDFGESMLTDLPWPVKQFIGAAPLKQAETAATHQLLQHAPPSWIDAYDEVGDLTSLEARILKAADRIQMLAKSLQYRQQHRGHIDRFWTKSEHQKDYGLPIVRDILDRLRQHFEQNTWIEQDM